MEPGYVDFQVELGNWNESKRIPIVDDIRTPVQLGIFPMALRGADAAIDSYLGKAVSLVEVDAILGEALGEPNPDKAFPMLTARKMGQAITTATDQPGWQAKEKKEMQQFIRARCARKLIEREGLSVSYGGVFPPMDVHGGFIQFIANYPKWKCIKKYRITEGADPRTFMEFMSSYKVSLENRFEAYLLSLGGEQLPGLVENAPDKTAKPSATLSYIKEMASREVKDDHLPSYASTYLARKLFRIRGLFTEASQIEIPGLKRLLRKKK
ncbi:MAG: hypothetical protein Q8P05_04100 [Candidatus Diapherotrites archaeon]|nr:hypothetical protein [Candidatus Diapherotrites archaeon]